MYEPQFPEWENRIRQSFARQSFMSSVGATLVKVLPGEIHIGLPYRATHLQQHGYLHGGLVASILDSACGYAALSLMPAEREVVTVEFKINFLSPADGDNFVAVGRVVKSGRTLTVCSGEVLAQRGAGRRAVAAMQATMFATQPIL